MRIGMRAAAAMTLAAALFAAPAAAPAAATEQTYSGVYQVRFLGAAAGELRFAVSMNEYGYRAESSQRTTGIVRSMVKNRQDYDSSAAGEIGPDGRLTPRSYRHAGGKRQRVVEVAYLGDDVGVKVEPAFGSWGAPPATKAQIMAATDALTAYAALMASGAPCPHVSRIFDGRQLFSLAYTPAGVADIAAKGWSGRAIKCAIQYERVAGFDAPEPGEKPQRLFVKPMSIWFAPLDNGLFAPVRIEIPTTFMGQTAIVELTAYAASGARPSNGLAQQTR